MVSTELLSLSPCDIADALPREQFMDYGIQPLWQGTPRIAGPAFTVYCAPGDHLMLHAAIYAAAPGDVIVVQADDRYALAGGNVCAIAQARGIAGLVTDGCVRDLGEIRQRGFPVFARGVIPKPGGKKHYSPLQQPVVCGGVKVSPGDYVLADEEGVAVIPATQVNDVIANGKARVAKEQAMGLTAWQQEHEAKVAELVARLRP
jgi:regulator of RNase E activity RraA